jgi:hypothetical protein
VQHSDSWQDASRLPEGYERIGYDADTQVYTFKSPTGELYESEPGNRYGELWPAGQRPQLTPSEIEANNAMIRESNTSSVRMFLPFALVIVVFMMLVFKLVSWEG